MAKSKKGGAFERKICKLLSMWYSHGIRDDIFWRTAGSGARATVRMKVGKMTADSAGDMCAIHESGKRLTKESIWEFKRGYTSKKQNRGSINLISIVDKMANEKDPVIIQWFLKLRKELQDHNRKYGFIIFQRDRKNACIAMTLKTWEYLKRRNIKKYYWPPFGPTAIVMSHQIEFLVMKLEDFLEWCEPETIGRPVRRRQKGKPHEQDIDGTIRRKNKKLQMEAAASSRNRILPFSRRNKKSKEKAGRTISRRRKKG